MWYIGHEGHSAKGARGGGFLDKDWGNFFNRQSKFAVTVVTYREPHTPDSVTLEQGKSD